LKATSPLRAGEVEAVDCVELLDELELLVVVEVLVVELTVTPP